jgi:hypothetical protein
LVEEQPDRPIEPAEEHLFTAVGVQLSHRTLGDHRRTAINALAQLLPGGGAFVELYGTYLPSRRQRRVEEFLIKDVPRALDDLVTRVGRVEEARILSEPYADVFEDVLAAVATRRGLEKRTYFASILANALADDAPEADMQDRLIATLDGLRISHLRMLE